MQLAVALGMSRQRLAYHMKRPDSPGRRSDGRYCIAEWSEWFEQHGIETRGEPWLQPVCLASGRRPRLREDMDWGAGVRDGVYHVGESLPQWLLDVFKECGIDATQAAVNNAAVALYSRMERQVDETLARWGYSEPFSAPMDDGTSSRPVAILAITDPDEAARILQEG